NWKGHYAKLKADCDALHIDCPESSLLLDDIARLFAHHKDKAVAKIIITRGIGARGYAIQDQMPSNRIVLRSPYPQLPQEYFDQGVRLTVCQLRLSHQPKLAGVKHLNRLENVIARSEWSDVRFADGILLDVDQNVIECTMSNLFIRNGTVLKTPDLTRCGVSGVTRQKILDLAPAMGYQVEISDIALNDLFEAEEVLICNSLIGVWQVRQIEQKQWPLDSTASCLRTRLLE